MTALVRTTSDHPDFIELVALLDADLKIRDGEEHTFYAQYNKIDAIAHVIVLYIDHIPVGCGAIKAFNANSMEVKRMYIRPEYRNQGLAKRIVQALESWMSELGYSISTLETGQNNPEAISLYLKLGYTVIPNYGQYIGIENSVCMHKILNGQ